MNRPIFINEQGNVLTSRRINLQDFNKSRLFFISTFFLLLFFTNPAHLQRIGNRTTPSSVKEWLGRDVHWTKKRRHTNYVLFAMTKNVKGIDILILRNEYTICEYFGKAPAVCKWISDNICHEVELSAYNRPFVALRLLQIMKITSFIFGICYKHGTFMPAADGLKNPVISMLSTLYQPQLHSDFILLNRFMYPCFILVDRIVTAGTSSTEMAVIHFYSLVFAIVTIIGGFSNGIGYTMTKELVGGMKGSSAAALGVICAAKPYKIMIDWLDLELTSGDILFGIFAVTTIANLFGFELLIGWKMSDSISWMTGGLLGYGLFNLIMSHYNLWWWSF